MTAFTLLCLAVALLGVWVCWLAMRLYRLTTRIDFLRERQDQHRHDLERLKVEKGKLPYTSPDHLGFDAKWLNGPYVGANELRPHEVADLLDGMVERDRPPLHLH